MNYIDLLLLVIFAFSVWDGYRQGFIQASLALISWTGSLWVSFIAYQPVASLLLKLMPATGVWAPPVAFILLAIITRLFIDNIAYRILERTPLNAHTATLNRAFGVLPGIVNGVIWAAFAAVFLMLMPLTTNISQTARDSRAGEKLVPQVEWLQNKLAPVFGEALNHAMPKNRVEVGKETPVELPFKVASAKRRPDLEEEMLELVNAERVKRHLKPLKADTEIAVVASKHSADMLARGYFSHYTPEGDDPFDRMRRDKVRFLTAGENLALAPTLAIAHKGLMESPGHRANILNPAFGRLGIGILDTGIYGLMITQNFRN
ncbi:hypothetical protein EOD41_05355 [Mucilaginibacter limnophilus]|uniref:SCP domain-containing protein n=1 Tax=Mucilaginibacter limnophilus TaxID=1932778 RepID=A0A437MUR8_9SPHI|nr:CvpA family protein [Mucilaginibacter limnophilus]RVU01392.1 hypothetical protein EOD41_05355 [Mucilaginibacter limnophilus]